MFYQLTIKCLVHKDKELKHVCISDYCTKHKICCDKCLDINHKTHEIISIDKYVNNLK